MSLADQIANDQATFLADWGEAFTVKLGGATVKTLTGIFDEAVETVSPHEAETVVIRPAVSVADNAFAGLGKSHTYTRAKTGAVYKIFGDPQPDGSGMTQLFLVKA